MPRFLLLLIAAFPSLAQAAGSIFDPNSFVTGSNLTAAQLSTVGNTIAADLRFRPVEGARAKPGPWTLSIGVLGGAMSASKLRDAFPGNDVPPVVPEGDIVVVLQISRDVAAEVGFVPAISIGSNKFSKFGGGVKWTASRTLLGEHSGVELAFRGMMTKPSFSLVSGTAQLDYSGTIVGGNATVGFPVGGFEPYMGFGFFSSTGDMTGSGTADFFGTPIALTQALPLSTSSVEFFGGLALQAGPVGLGLEAEASFGTVSGIFKLSFQIGPFGDSEPEHEQRVARLSPRSHRRRATEAPETESPARLRKEPSPGA